MKIYKASAGSGKTYTLALEYIKELLCRPVNDSHRHILAVTFTKDATGEMKDRILAELYGLAYNCKDSKSFLSSIQNELGNIGKPMKEEEIQMKAKAVLHEILHDYSRLYITTIDSFFQKVLRNLARELGKGSKFNLEMNNSKVLSEAVNAMIENANTNPQVLDWLTTYIEGRLEEAGNWHVAGEILDFSRCIFDEYFQEHEDILKKQLNANPKIFEQILTEHSKIQKDCKIFFTKAYTEISQTMNNLGLSPDDFSRKGTVINFFKKLSEGDYSVKTDGTTIKDCCSDAEKWGASKSKRKTEITELATINFIPLLTRCLDVLKKFNTSQMVTKNIHQLGLIWDITKEIEQQNNENNRFMLSDTALFLNKMIDNSDAPFIYEKIGAEIRHVMIDEFQDTSRLQWKNFKALLSNIIANNYFSLIVGDVKQSIYRWRNGDWSILNNIENELNSEIKTLDYNFRSEAEVIDFNNRIFTHAANLLNEKYSEIFDDIYESPFISSYAPQNVVQHTHKKEKKGYVSINFIPDKTDEMEYGELVLEQIISKIQLLKEQGIKPKDICILTRKNKNIVTIAEYIASQRTNYPELASGNYLNIVSSEAFQLNSSIAIRIIIEALHLISDPNTPVHKALLDIFLKQIYHTEISLTGLQDINSDNQTESIIQGLSPTLPLFELIGHLFRSLHLDKLEGQSNYMFTFYDAVSNYLKDNSGDIFSFLKYWENELQFKSIPAGNTVDGIRAMTIHKSKGLQFHTVLLPYCDWNLYPEKNPVVWCGPKHGLSDLELLPIKYSQKMYETVFLPEYEKETRQSWMDNLNVLYVAFTRAEHNLLILAQNKKKLSSVEDIKTVSDLLQFSTQELNGIYDSDLLLFEKGILQEPKLQEKKSENDNVLKEELSSLDISFVSEPFNQDKTIFKQSDKSREFIKGENSGSDRKAYIKKGNLLHELFSHINTLNDIERAVNKLCSDGLIAFEEKQEYINNVIRIIKKSGKEDWFSGNYQLYNECTILSKENGINQTHRPDRVLIKNNMAIVIDYKFGEFHSSHEKQISQYVDLMKKMGYEQVEGHLWYMDMM